MSVVPDKITEKIQYFEDRLPAWTANATAIGSSAAEITAMQTKTQAARDAYTAQQAAKVAGEAATTTLHNAFDAMSIAGAGIIEQARKTAKVTGNPEVYALAQIPAPATPTPVGPPGTPSDFAVEVQQDGTVVLTWKCNNPAGAGGTTYNVYRRNDPSGSFEFLGTAGQRKFIDSTIPAGSSNITYQIQGVRSTAIGAFAQFNVNFGFSSGGTMTASVTPVLAAPKLAA